MAGPKLRRAALGLCAALVVAGCGTTVRQPVGGGAVNGDLGGPSTESARSAPGETGMPSIVGSSEEGLGTAGSRAGGTAPSAVTSGAPAPGSRGRPSPSARPSGTAPVSGVGFDRERVYIGVGTANDAGAYASSLGYEVTPGDVRAQAQALIDDINRKGGLVGRQIVPIWHDVNTAEYNSNPSSATQAQCATWTEDHRVFAAVNVVAYPENGLACLAKAQTVALSSGAASPVLSALLRRHSPYFYAPGMAETANLVPALVDELVQQRYFTPWDTTAGAPGSAPVKIGVLYAADRPDLLDLTKQALAKHRLSVSDSFQSQSSSDSGQLAGVVLRFKSEGITHVLTYGYLAFMPRFAEAQGFRPRYGVSSWDGIQFAFSSASDTAPQFAGTMGVGWTPSMDVDADHDPGESPARRQCLALMRAAGQDTTNRTTAAVMESMCEQFGLLRAGLAGAVGLGPTVLRDGVDSLGRSFPSALTFGERFAADRHAGVAAYRAVRFDAACSCFAYDGPVRTFD